jgi:hypothetical protein
MTPVNATSDKPPVKFTGGHVAIAACAFFLVSKVMCGQGAKRTEGADDESAPVALRSGSFITGNWSGSIQNGSGESEEATVTLSEDGYPTFNCLEGNTLVKPNSPVRCTARVGVSGSYERVTVNVSVSDLVRKPGLLEYTLKSVYPRHLRITYHGTDSTVPHGSTAHFQLSAKGSRVSLLRSDDGGEWRGVLSEE